LVLTTLLKTEIRNHSAAEIVTEFTHGSIGTGTTVAAASDTALGTEVFRDAIDESDNPGTGIVTSSLRVLSTEANGNSITEYGWFDASSGGNLWTRNTITAISKTSDIQLFLDVQIKITVQEV